MQLPHRQRLVPPLHSPVTTDVTNPAFEAANLPPGLTCALGTGVISGTPLAGGTYVATLVAQSLNE